MRYFLLCCLVGLCFARDGQSQTGSDPQLRLNALGAALKRAKSVQVDFESELTADKGKVIVKGTLLLVPGNQARVSLAYALGEKEFDISVISNGTTTRTTTKGMKPRDKATDANLNANFLAMLERSGFAVPMFTITKAKGKDEPVLSRLLIVSDTKFLREDRKTYAFASRLTVEDKVRFNVETILEDASSLPLRRVLTVDKGADPVTIRETYRIQLNVEVKEGTFTIAP